MATRAAPGRHLRPAPSLQTRLFDGELVILDMVRGEYFALDAIGSRLWTGLQAGTTFEQIAEEVVAEYEVSIEQATADLQALAEDLLTKGLLVVEGDTP